MDAFKKNAMYNILMVVQYTACLDLIGYDTSKIDSTASIIIKNLSKYNVDLQKKPFVKKISVNGDEPTLWGCNYEDVTRKTMTVRGSLNDMKNLIHVETPDGVLVEFSLCD